VSRQKSKMADYVNKQHEATAARRYETHQQTTGDKNSHQRHLLGQWVRPLPSDVARIQEKVGSINNQSATTAKLTRGHPQLAGIKGAARAAELHSSSALLVASNTAKAMLEKSSTKSIRTPAFSNLLWGHWKTATCWVTLP